MDFFKDLWEGILLTGIWEWLAFATGMLYLILATKRMILCWLFAFISSAIFVYLCIIGSLYSESVLNLFYVVMAIVGWLSWRKGKNEVQEVKIWTLSQHAINILLSGIIAGTLGYLADTFTDQAYPYVDAFTTVYSLAATYMVTRKVMENWLYWIVIDFVSIFLYGSRGYQLLSLQMAIYTVLAFVAFMAWRKQYKQQST